MLRQEVKEEPGAEKEAALTQELLGVTQANLVCLGLGSGEDPITLKVQKQNEEDVYYRMGKNVSLGVLMMDYYDRKGLGRGTIQFLDPEGNLLNVTQTPQGLNLEDGDVIDAMFHQMGGYLVI